jgi:hypothetical protein
MVTSIAARSISLTESTPQSAAAELHRVQFNRLFKQCQSGIKPHEIPTATQGRCGKRPKGPQRSRATEAARKSQTDIIKNRKRHFLDA